MAASRSRANLPIPDPQPVDLATYDTKDPEVLFPAIDPLRPPRGAPNALLVLLDVVEYF